MAAHKRQCFGRLAQPAKPKHNRNRRQSAEYTEAHRGLLALQADEFQWTPFQIVCGCQTNDCTFGFRDMKKDKKPYADVGEWPAL